MRLLPDVAVARTVLGAFALTVLPFACDGGSSFTPDGGDADADTDTDTDADSDTEGQCPEGMVEIPGFDACIDSYEHTNSKFLEFLNDHGNDYGQAASSCASMLAMRSWLNRSRAWMTLAPKVTSAASPWAVT